MKLLKPFSNNIIFWDSEFSDLNPYKGELLSMGFVKPSGEELYLELELPQEMDPWVVENVVPYLNGPKVTKEEAIKQITAFCGDLKPYFVAFVNQFDTIYLYKLLNLKGSTKNFPFNWIHVDFAAMLFANGYDPNAFSGSNAEKIASELGIDESKYRNHHALDDAKFLRDIYLKIVANE